MNFEHSEDRRMLADSFGRLLREQCAFETRERIARSPQGWSPELWKQVAELGLIGALFGEADGGYGGIGMTWGLPLAHYAKRLVMIDHQLGDEDQQLERYIALGRA